MFIISIIFICYHSFIFHHASACFITFHHCDHFWVVFVVSHLVSWCCMIFHEIHHASSISIIHASAYFMIFHYFHDPFHERSSSHHVPGFVHMLMLISFAICLSCSSQLIMLQHVSSNDITSVQRFIISIVVISFHPPPMFHHVSNFLRHSSCSSVVVIFITCHHAESVFISSP